jgi:hypothetical protein
MQPIDLLTSKLHGVKKSGSGWSARCPAHDDRKASLSVSEGDDGRALVKCHAGCTTEQVVAAVGLELRDLFPEQTGWAAGLIARNGRSHGQPRAERPPPRAERPPGEGQTFATAHDALAVLDRQLGRHSCHWTYTDRAGQPVGLVARWDGLNGKTIRPVSRRGDGWVIGAMPDPRPLYRLPDLADAKLVVVCEGEKAADAARRLGFIATTSAGGAAAAAKSDWRPLANKEIWILPDNDAPGRKYANDVAGILVKLTPAPVVRIVELPGLPEGGDIVDWIDSHGGAAEPDTMRAKIEALAQAVEPWRPDDADDLPYRPFPLDALPDPIRGFVDAGARAIGCDVSYLALPLLTALAAAIGNTRRLELKRGWCVPPILWGAIVGESGTAKTPAFRLVMRPVRNRQRKALERHAEEMKQYKADLACWEKDMSAWKKKGSGLPPAEPEEPHAERFIVSDTTVEALAPILLDNPRGLLLARDELAGWIGSFDRYAGKSKAGSDSANWLSMFNAESIFVDRKTGIPRTIHVPQAAVCVSGGIQPAILRRALGVEHRESGLAARLLLTCPPRKAKRWTEADIDPSAEAELARLFDRLYELQPTTDDDGEPRPRLVRLSGDAQAAWIAYYNAHAAEQADLTGDMAAAWSKLEEYAARLALVVHFIRWAAGDVANETRLDAASMNAGIVLAKWFKHEARRVYAMLDESDTERDQRRLVEWIGRKGGTATAREVQQGCRWLKEPGAAESALEELVKAGRGSWRNVPTTAKGGRPARAFVLSTPSTVYETPTKPVESEGFVDVDSVDTEEVESRTPTPAVSTVYGNTEFPGENNNTVDVDAVDDSQQHYPGGRLFPDQQQLPD